MSDGGERLRRALADRYRLDREIGRGGMATVYLAEDLKHHRAVAVKVLRPELAAALGPGRFLREIAISARLAHPHVLPLHDSGEADGFLYYVMPYVEGESLRDRLNREKQLPLEDALEITREVADALAHAHSHDVVHRDIKPENILLEAGHAVVADFGIARAITAAGGTRLTETGLAVGTPAYMSPEQAAGAGKLDGRSDLYSLGCVLYEMLAGDPPFTASTAQALIAKKLSEPLPRVSIVRETVPPHVETALSRAMARVPADRFRTLADFAAALSLPAEAAPSLTTAPARRRRGGRWALLLGAGAVLAAGVFLLGLPAVRDLIERKTTRTYTDTPRWSPWRGWTGEYFSVVAVADSGLVVSRLGADAAQMFDGQRWTTLSIPDSFDVRPYVGTIPSGRLFATRTATSPSGQRLLQYWWMSLSPGAIRPLTAISGYLPDEGRPRWWSDDHDLVIWISGIQRLDGEAWVREPTGTAGRIARVWGSDVSRRFALPSTPRDSLLVFDGISWKLVDILGGRSSGRPSYKAGATFRDGTTMVVGEECADEERCRPLILEQGAFNGRWRRVPIPAGIGMPVALERDTIGTCDPGRFSLEDVAGRSRGDYVVWGTWLTCDVGSPAREASGCPPGQPCFWQVEDGGLKPVEDLLGEAVQAVVYMDTTAYALVDDGTLWRRVGDHWRPVTQVPSLPLRLVGASPQIIVRAVGGTIEYEPGRGDSLSLHFISPELGVPTSVTEATPPRQLVVRDSSAGLLTADGSAFVSRCRMVRGPAETPGVVPSAGASGLVLRCPKWGGLPAAPGNVTAIAFLADGSLIGVGARGLAVTWRNGTVRTESLPEAARGDSLWGVVASADGGATAIGSRTVVQRGAGGAWTMVRRFAEGRIENPHFAVLPDGDLVVAGRAIHVWDRSTDTLPAVTLYQSTSGEAQVSALHVLADGRLVAGFANPEEPTLGGRLIVWAPPARANRARQVDLPLNLDITDLADDGRYLYVAGRGGALTIPLDSLPFASASRTFARLRR